jgi:hypothetical protein
VAPPVPPADWPSDLDAAVEEVFEAFAHRPKPVNRRKACTPPES